MCTIFSFSCPVWCGEWWIATLSCSNLRKDWTSSAKTRKSTCFTCRRLWTAFTSLPKYRLDYQNHERYQWCLIEIDHLNHCQSSECKFRSGGNTRSIKSLANLLECLNDSMNESKENYRKFQQNLSYSFFISLNEFQSTKGSNRIIEALCLVIKIQHQDKKANFH